MNTRTPVLCQSHSRRVATAVLVALVASKASMAGVSVDGEVTPADNAATFSFEGIVDYRFVVNFDEEVLLDQPLFGNPFDIGVGTSGYGLLVIDQASTVRYEQLVIGGDTADADADADEFLGPETGIGIVRIDGFGSLFNNAPEIIPAQLLAAGATTEADIDSSPRMGTGNDVYVGLTGSGLLQLLDGGRMEIQDTLVVGASETGVGIVEVSGFGSNIDQRGTAISMSGQPETVPMLIGPVGEGELRINNYASVDARQGVAIGALALGVTTGAVNQPISLGGIDEATGVGIVEVEGFSSRLRAAVGITVGVFYEDPSDYEPFDGRGSLYVSDNALVSIYRQDAMETNPEEADLLVGLNGLVGLAGGRVTISDGLYNDGKLQGGGRINLATFSNRANGLVNVGEGEKLRVISASESNEFITDDTGSYFMANNGLIDVLGGEIEFQRVFVDELDMFLNRFKPAVDLEPSERGRIHGQYSVMRFHSGLMNQAVLAFTAGDNVLSGDVINDLTGSILLSGNANAVFEDDLTNLGVIELAPDGTAVSLTVLGDFINFPSSTLSLALGGGPGGAELSSLAVTGDIVLGGLLNVDAPASGLLPLDLQVGDQFELISGTGTLSGAFNALSLPTLPDPTWSWGIDTSNSDFTLVVLDVLPVGADFNGDGIVDEGDLDIWRANFGIEIGRHWRTGRC